MCFEYSKRSRALRPTSSLTLHTTFAFTILRSVSSRVLSASSSNCRTSVFASPRKDYSPRDFHFSYRQTRRSISERSSAHNFLPFSLSRPVMSHDSDFPLSPLTLPTRVRRDNARHHGKCRLITPSVISRYKVDGRRALKPPLGSASTSCASSPPRFAVSHRLSPGDATRPAAGDEAGGRASRVSLWRSWRRLANHGRRRQNSAPYYHRAPAKTTLPIYLSLFSSFRFLCSTFDCLFPRGSLLSITLSFSFTSRCTSYQFIFVFLPTSKPPSSCARACRVIVITCMHGCVRRVA